MARPRKDKSQLGKPVAFRLPQHAYERWIQKVEASGLTPSEFFRRAVIDNETIIVAAPVQTEDERRQLFLISKASNNLNQLAHALNYARVKCLLDRKLCIDLLMKLDIICGYLKTTLKTNLKADL